MALEPGTRAVLVRTEDPERWARAARASGQPVTAFHSFDFLQLAATMTGTTFVPLVVAVGGVDVGTATWLRRRRGLVTTVNRVPFPYVGPLVPAELLPATLRALRVRALRERATSQQYQLPPGATFDAGRAPAGFELRMDSTYVVDTTRSEGELWAALESRARNKVRGAERRGVEITALEAPQAVLARVVDTVFERQGCPSGYNQHFPPEPAALRTGGLDVRWVVATLDGVELGSLVTLFYGDAAVGWVGGILPEHRSTNANVAMYWDAIQWSARVGARHLDLVGVPGAGIGTFKRQFGSTLEEYPAFTRVEPGVERIRDARRYPALWRDRRRQRHLVGSGAAAVETSLAERS